MFNNAFKSNVVPIGVPCRSLDYEVINSTGVQHKSIYEGAHCETFNLKSRIEQNALGNGVSPHFRATRLDMTDTINNQISNIKN